MSLQLDDLISQGAMKIKYTILAVVAPLVLVIDQTTKLAIVTYVELGSRHPVISGFFDIVHFQNSGAAFGLFSGTHESFRVPFFYVIAAIAALLLSFFYRSLDGRERLMPVVLSLIFGGIAGNILDRIFLGSVVDFLSFHIGDAALDFHLPGRPIHMVLEWPAFNVADSAITIAVSILIYKSLFKKPGIS